MVDWLKLYERMPYALRVVAASARGYYLRWWHYGRETERLVEEALERETWSPERWKAWREERLAYVLQRAVSQWGRGVAVDGRAARRSVVSIAARLAGGTDQRSSGYGDLKALRGSRKGASPGVLGYPACTRARSNVVTR